MLKRVLVPTAMLLLGGLLPAQEHAPQPRQLRQGEVRGTVLFSDGSAVSGIIHCTGFGQLKVFDSGEGKFKNIPLEHVALLRVEVAKAEMVKEWRFREESKNEKVYSGGEYPRKDYEVRVSLRGGGEVRGTCVAVLYAESGDEKTRLELKHYDRGTTQETLDDLVHVAEFRFADPDEKPADRRIFGEVKPAGRLVDAIAVQHKYRMFVQGKVDSAAGKYVIKDLLPGCYDLVFVTKDSVFAAVGMKGEDFAEDSLSEQDRTDIARRVREIEDFFEEKRVLHAAGNIQKAKAIVKTVRRGKTSLEKQGDVPLIFFHIEYWVLHKVGERWLVDWRIQLLRDKGEQETKKDTKGFVLRPELADKEVKPAGTQLRVDFDSAAAGGGEKDVIGR